MLNMQTDRERQPLLEDSSQGSTCPTDGNVQFEEPVGCCGSVWRVVRELKNITVEPVLFLYFLSWMVQTSVSTNLLLDKVCVEKNFSSEVCGNLSDYPKEQIEVQVVVTKINMYMDLLTNIPSVLFVLFLGPWSDRHGRKFPMVLPMFGNLVSSVIYIVNVYWFSLPSLFILVAGVPRAMTGGFIMLIMACYAYISDITKIRSRTMRIAFMDLFMVLGSPLGLLLSDIIYAKYGYIGIYGTSALIFLVAIIYIIVRIEDTRGRFSKYRLEATELTHSQGNMCKDLVDTDNVKQSIAICFKPRRDKKRTKIILLMLAMCSLLFLFGTGAIDYLYTRRMFGWTYSQYIHLGLIEVFVSLVGNSIVLPIVSYRLQTDDALLGLIGCISKIASLIIKALALYPWFLYLSACVNFLGGLALIIIRSMMSKIIPPEDLGMIFSVLASWESILPLVSHPLCTVVYNATIELFPGTVFYMLTFFVGIAAIIFIWLYVNRNYVSPGPHIHEEEIIQSIET